MESVRYHNVDPTPMWTPHPDPNVDAPPRPPSCVHPHPFQAGPLTPPQAFPQPVVSRRYLVVGKPIKSIG